MKSKKFTEFCCAGVYSTKYSISNIIEFFVKNKKLSNLDKFLTVNGNEHYELEYKKEKITYKKDTNYKFKKFSKYKNDFLINYNFYKNYWKPV